MTEKLFYQDSYMKSFTAQVLACHKEGEKYKVVLNRTAFFPEGGGQYADTGMLERGKVLDVQEQKDVIFHVTERAFEPGETVTGVIDFEERFMKMQQHTGEHIVSGLVHARFGYHNVGFHLGSKDCTMDFDGEITKEELLEIEQRANEAVVQNLEVIVSYPEEEELKQLSYRSKIEIDGQVRIVTVPGYDVCACCAPHVKRTGEIGQIKLTDVKRYKGGVRVTMLCGFRALQDYNRKLKAVKQISAALCAKEDETAEAVEYLKKECAKQKLRIGELQKELFRYKVKEIDKSEETVCLFEPELDGENPRHLMNLTLDEGHTVCAVFFGKQKNAYRYVIGSRQMDLRALARGLNEAFDGKGGGKPEMVQGTLYGNEEALKGWIQEKVRKLKYE